MAQLVPSAHAKDFATEVYGVLDNDVQYYISKQKLDTVREQDLVHRCPDLDPLGAIYVAIDPASHDKSHMGISAMVIPRDGSKLFWVSAVFLLQSVRFPNARQWLRYFKEGPGSCVYQTNNAYCAYYRMQFK